MNRRQFTFSLGALAAAPLVPALPASASASNALSGTAARIFPWAAQYARVNGKASAAEIARVFTIPPQAAKEISAQLVSKGITSAPTLGGVAKAVKPVNWQQLYSASGSTSAHSASKLGEKLKTLAEKADELTESTAATGSESERMPEDPQTGSEESPRA